MTDSEILKLAAKAAIGAGMPLHYGPHALQPEPHWQNAGDEWCPLTDDGDALRLAVKLSMADSSGLKIMLPDSADPWAVVNDFGHTQIEGRSDGADPYAATRRAIVRAAAEMGKTIE